MIKKAVIGIFILSISALLITLFMYNQRYRMDLFGNKGEKGMKWEITLPQTGLHEVVEVVKGEGRDVLRGIKNAFIIDKAVDDNNKVLYEISYSQDEFGRRVVDNSQEATEFALWFGGGDLYGMGVSREDSIPQIFSKSNTKYSSYNYGFAGIGAQYPLRLLEITDFKKEIKEKNGVMIYVISEAHYPKTLGRFLHIYRPEMPDYKLVEGKLKYMGTYIETEPLTNWIKMVFGNSWLRRMLGDINELTTYTQEEHDTVCAIISSTNDKFLKQYPSSKFILFLHTNLPYIDREELTKCVKKNNIPYIDSYMEYDEDKFDSDPIDGHPTGYLNKLLVDKFNEYLNSQR